MAEWAAAARPAIRSLEAFFGQWPELCDTV